MTVSARMTTQIDIHFSLQAAIREDRQTTSFVAYCPTLDLYSAGRTRIDAKKALTGAAVMYVRICYERGILGRLLKQKGFSAAQASAGDRPSDSSQFIAIKEYASEYDDVFDIEIPLHLVAQAQQEQRECPQ